MKHLHILLDNDTYDKLKAMTSYRGELSNIVRIILQNFVKNIKHIPSTDEKVAEVIAESIKDGV